MLAQVSITPVGVGEEIKDLLAKTLKIIAKSELSYQLTSMGTIIEGDWDEVMTIVKKCHEELLGFSERVVTSITVDDRKNMTDRLKKNALDIEYAVGDNLATNGLT